MLTVSTFREIAANRLCPVLLKRLPNQKLQVADHVIKNNHKIRATFSPIRCFQSKVVFPAAEKALAPPLPGLGLKLFYLNRM